jgi:hypothetical protein
LTINRIHTQYRLLPSLACSLLLITVTACSPQGEPTAAAPDEPQILFDDFSYTEFEEMGGNGWLARTEKGIPGVLGASFGPEGVSFEADPDVPDNQLMRLSSSTAGDADTTQQVQLCHQRKYLEGTYAARVHFEDAAAAGPDGDQVVETFYTISQMDEPNYSEADFEYLPNGGWGREEATFWVTTWAPWGRVRPKPEDAEHAHDNTSSQREGSLAGWHVLVLQVEGDSVSYFLDGEPFATHGDGYAPTAPLSINFNLWFVEGGLLDSQEPRQYVEHVDWVYHEAGATLTTEEIESRVAELRQESTPFQDTVPAWSPPLPSLCDL